LVTDFTKNVTFGLIPRSGSRSGLPGDLESGKCVGMRRHGQAGSPSSRLVGAARLRAGMGTPRAPRFGWKEARRG